MTPRLAVTAAGGSGEHSDDGMVALVPTRDDAMRLSVPGGEPVEELHLTVAYFADAEQMPPAEVVFEQFRSAGVSPTAEVSGHAVFRGGDSPCAVYLVQGDGLTAFHEATAPADGDYDAYIPHITAAYSEQPLTEIGPTTFDRLRIAVRGEHTDYPIAEVMGRGM
ncbi:hypothetical protein JVX90_00270 [Gordonia sp. PDNC005]|uniref:hypothetical protein n=1 Tax=Gordonia sp. PDNC005 TaxID=2811424 RepID=UPI00196463F3|nr:hypothetical protein [Gordonia sp. PDNC005]QRY62747.1 hypothetical protein JVX90_00270 [Gordonia sp. PDNC005]